MRYLALISFLFLITSCSVKKRTYRDGFYVDWAFHKNHSQTKQTLLHQKNPELLVKEEVEKEKTFTASSGKTPVSELVKKRSSLFLPDTCGDIITFKSGDVVTAKVYEINDDKIKYKRCDNLTGPLFTVLKATIHSVKYTNGVTEIIETTLTTPSETTDNIQKPIKPTLQKDHPMSIWALVLTILGFLPWFWITLWIISLILAGIAIKDIKAFPDMYKGLKMAKITRTIDIVMLALSVLVFIMAILFVLALFYGVI